MNSQAKNLQFTSYCIFFTVHQAPLKMNEILIPRDITPLKATHYLVVLILNFVYVCWPCIPSALKLTMCKKSLIDIGQKCWSTERDTWGGYQTRWRPSGTHWTSPVSGYSPVQQMKRFGKLTSVTEHTQLHCREAIGRLPFKNKHGSSHIRTPPQHSIPIGRLASQWGRDLLPLCKCHGGFVSRLSLWDSQTYLTPWVTTNRKKNKNKNSLGNLGDCETLFTFSL